MKVSNLVDPQRQAFSGISPLPITQEGNSLLRYEKGFHPTPKTQEEDSNKSGFLFIFFLFFFKKVCGYNPLMRLGREPTHWS